MFAYPLPSILTHFQTILIKHLSNPIRINPTSIYFSLFGVYSWGHFRKNKTTIIGDQNLCLPKSKTYPNPPKQIQRHPSQRNRSGCKWNNSLRAFHDVSWLQNCRASFVPLSSRMLNPWSVLAGRTGTRAAAGKVQPRWQEAVQRVRDGIY